MTKESTIVQISEVMGGFDIIQIGNVTVCATCVPEKDDK